MALDLIDSNTAETALNNARNELPRLVESYSLHNRLDAHQKASVPGSLLSTLETLSFFASSGSLTQERAYEYLGAFDQNYKGKSYSDLGETLSNYVRNQLGLRTIEVSSTSLSHVERIALRNIAQFTDLTESPSNPHISNEAFSAALIRSASNVLKRSERDPSLHMGEYEKELLNREILYLSEAKPAAKGSISKAPKETKREELGAHREVLRHFHLSPTQKMAANQNTYRVSMLTLRGVDVLNAYEHMKSKSNNAGYKNAVSFIFSDLAETLSRSTQSR